MSYQYKHLTSNTSKLGKAISNDIGEINVENYLSHLLRLLGPIRAQQPQSQTPQKQTPQPQTPQNPNAPKPAVPPKVTMTAKERDKALDRELRSHGVQYKHLIENINSPVVKQADELDKQIAEAKKNKQPYSHLTAQKTKAMEQAQKARDYSQAKKDFYGQFIAKEGKDKDGNKVLLQMDPKAMVGKASKVIASDKTTALDANVVEAMKLVRDIYDPSKGDDPSVSNKLQEHLKTGVLYELLPPEHLIALAEKVDMKDKIVLPPKTDIFPEKPEDQATATAILAFSSVLGTISPESIFSKDPENAKKGVFQDFTLDALTELTETCEKKVAELGDKNKDYSIELQDTQKAFDDAQIAKEAADKQKRLDLEKEAKSKYRAKADVVAGMSDAELEEFNKEKAEKKFERQAKQYSKETAEGKLQADITRNKEKDAQALKNMKALKARYKGYESFNQMKEGMAKYKEDKEDLKQHKENVEMRDYIEEHLQTDAVVDTDTKDMFEQEQRDLQEKIDGYADKAGEAEKSTSRFEEKMKRRFDGPINEEAKKSKEAKDFVAPEREEENEVESNSPNKEVNNEEQTKSQDKEVEEKEDNNEITNISVDYAASPEQARDALKKQLQQEQEYEMGGGR